MTKRKSSKQELVPGLVFAIPLPNGGFGLGKLLFQAPWRDIAKLYAVRTAVPFIPSECSSLPVVADQLLVAGSGIQSGDWPKVAFEDIKANEDLAESCFIMGLPPLQKVRKLKDYSIVRTASPEDTRRYPGPIVNNQFHFEKILDEKHVKIMSL